MEYTTVLALHLVGAAATAIAGAYSLVALWNNLDDKYRLSAIVLGALAGFEILSGTVLSVLSLQVSAASLCGRIFLYLSLVAVVEALLFARMKKLSFAYPLMQVFSPVAASLMVFLSAIAYGV